MNHSIFWARLMGLYTVILALWCFYDIRQLYPLMMDLSNNPLMLMCFGTFTVFLGLAILVSHSVFKGWPILVTLTGYLVTLKGIILLFFPQWASPMVMFWKNENMLFAPLPALVIGLFLMYFGFMQNSK